MSAEQESFEAVYANHFDFVWRSILRLGIPESQAEDVAQDVFVVVHERLDTFEGRSKLKTWIFGVVRGIVRNHRRAQVRRREKHDRAQREPVGSSPPTPDDELAEHEARQVLYAILDELDDARREVFVLAELEQMPVVEVAEALGENLNTVYSRLRQARQQFQKAAARNRARDGWRVR